MPCRTPEPAFARARAPGAPPRPGRGV